MTQTAPAVVPYEAFQHERELRIKAERDRDYWKDEFYLLRKVRRAPVLKPVAKEVLAEFRHVEKWGQVKDSDGKTRANFSTIAKNLHISPDTVARQAERMAQLDLVEIHEHAGPQDEYDRKYVHVKEDKLAIIDQLEDTEDIVPKQGGNRYTCQRCDGEVEMEIRKVTTRRTITTLRCPKCDRETQLSDTGEIKTDTGWIKQDGQKTQKQLAFDQPSPTDVSNDAQKMQDAQKQLAFDDSPPEQDVSPEPQKQNAEHSVYTQPPTPAELQALPIWACHRDKQPYIAELSRWPQHAKSNDPTTWRTYEQAKAIYEQSLREGWKYPYSGIGFMCTGDFTVIDYDHCIDENGNMSDQARTWIDSIDSYAELSPSCTGVHQIVRGTLPRNIKQPGCEMYDHLRFVTFTGQHMPVSPATIEDRQEQLAVLFAAIAPTSPPKEAPRADTVSTLACPLADDEVIEKARGASNGAKFLKLWLGDASDYRKADGSPDNSSADLALCRMLAYWTDDDPLAMDRLFRRSGLYREKWDRAARAGETYGEGTIRIARGQQLAS